MRCGDEEVSEEEEEEEEDDDDDDDDDDDECAVCRGADSQPGNEMLLCDRRGCDGAYHQQCLRPAVRRVPEGAWHCPTCAAGAKLVCRRGALPAVCPVVAANVARRPGEQEGGGDRPHLVRHREQEAAPAAAPPAGAAPPQKQRAASAWATQQKAKQAALRALTLTLALTPTLTLTLTLTPTLTLSRCTCTTASRRAPSTTSSGARCSARWRRA